MATNIPEARKGSNLVRANPFDVTKAVDFSDVEIGKTFVEYPDGGFHSFADPTQPMPHFLVGGKGGGRTHLMRHFSYQLQRLRASNTIAQQIKSEGYLGVYFRCSGLNALRFKGKGQSRDAWSSVFNYYLDVWITQQLINAVADIAKDGDPWSLSDQAVFADAVFGLSDSPDPSLRVAEVDNGTPLESLVEHFRLRIRLMDRVINNAALRGSLDIEIESAPGKLIFESAIAASKLPGFEQVKITFLVDELENLDADQQAYLNTLIREKELPTTFVIGSRRWGVRTQATLSAGEENKRGSEFEWTVLEESYRADDGKKYAEFCERLVLRRIQQAGFQNIDRSALDRVLGAQPINDRFLSEEMSDLVSGSSFLDRPYFRVLRRKLVRSGTHGEEFAESVIEKLSFPSEPLLEKYGTFRFYQEWSRVNVPTLEAADSIRADNLALSTWTASAGLKNRWNQRRSDMIAQIYRDCSSDAPTRGFEQFVEMSGYLPRSLLTTLKYVTKWAIAYGETHFLEASEPIPANVQAIGVKEAAEWFVKDNRPLGRDGESCDTSIRRLGSFLRKLRFSDKPVEISCATFTVARNELSLEALRILDLCVSHSLVIEWPDGRQDRNSGEKLPLYQLNPMIAPLYGLPTARRGIVDFSADEARVIFEPSTSSSEFDSHTARRVDRMNAPFSASNQGLESLFDEA